MRTLEYPENYLVWDLETSGLEKEAAKILEIGCFVVKKGEVTERKSWLLHHPGIELSAQIVEITGITELMLEEQGVDPVLAIKEFVDFIYSHPGFAHITHNGIKFDIEWLAYHAAKSLGWTVGQHKDFLAKMHRNAIDTAVFVKAGKLGMKRMWNETFKEFADRVMGVFAKGVKYNVGLCCEEMGIDKSKVTQHRALGDVELTHEIYKKLLVA